MPIATIHVLEGRYDERRIGNESTAIQDSLISVLKILSDDFFQIIHVLPRNRFLHTPSFLGMKYSDDFILLELAFISGRLKETRLALLKELNARIVAAAGISPDDLMVQLTEATGENFSFGQGLAQRVHLTSVLKQNVDALPAPPKSFTSRCALPVPGAVPQAQRDFSGFLRTSSIQVARSAVPLDSLRRRTCLREIRCASPPLFWHC